jgi:hypothetical protein
MAVMCNANVPTERLTWDGKRKWFVAEASELPAPERVWDDACDVGYRLISHRTGKAEVFYLAAVQRDADGDIQVWIYRPVNRRVVAEFHVLND